MIRAIGCTILTAEVLFIIALVYVFFNDDFMIEIGRVIYG